MAETQRGPDFHMKDPDQPVEQPNRPKRPKRPKGTRARIRAVCGIWLLDGRLVKLHENARTGVLLASYSNGERENPLKVLTKGTRAELPEWSPPRAHSHGHEDP
jgi:hypothetical protein